MWKVPCEQQQNYVALTCNLTCAPLPRLGLIACEGERGSHAMNASNCVAWLNCLLILLLGIDLELLVSISQVA